jgi:hypothetical protein
MNFHDTRTVGEQVKSGFRIAALILLAFALVAALLPSTVLLVGKGSNPQLSGQMLGGAGLIGISVLMFFTVRSWAKWFVVFLSWVIIRSAIAAPLSSRSTPAWWILELLLILVALFALSMGAALRQDPEKVETVGLIIAALSLSFATVLVSYVPLLIAVGALALARLITWRRLAGGVPNSSSPAVGTTN